MRHCLRQYLRDGATFSLRERAKATLSHIFINQNIIDMKNLGIMDICMIKHGLSALIANEKVTIKIAIKKGDKEQIERSN